MQLANRTSRNLSSYLHQLLLEHRVSLLTTLAVVILSLAGLSLAGRGVLLPIAVLLIDGLAFNILLYLLERRGRLTPAYGPLARAGNVTFITLGVYLSGGLTSPFIPLYAIYIVVGAIRHGRGGAWRCALYSVIASGFLILLAFPLTPEAIMRLLITEGLVIMTGLISGELGRRNLDAVADVRRHLEEMAVLNDIGRVISANREVEDLLEEIVHQAGRLMDVSNAYIILIDEESGRFTVPLLYREGRKESGHISANLENDLAAWVIRTRRPLLLRHAEQHSQADIERTLCRHALSWVGAPLSVGERVLGAIAVQDFEREEAFDREDISVLRAIASQAAVALENARLYHHLRERTERLRRAYEGLRNLERQQMELVRTLSHDLRAPLTFIKGYAALMLNEELGPLTERQRDALHIIATKSDMLARMAEDIVLSEQRRLGDSNMISVPIGELAREAVRGAAAAAAGDRDITFRVEVPDGAPVVLADPLRLMRVFDNLISNAVKYSPGGGTVTVRVTPGEEFVRVTVADEGIGIPPDELEHVFERFYRGKEQEQRQAKRGFGLGLSIVKEIVEEYGGEVWVDSEVGLGSAFHFTLPVSPRPPAPLPVPPRPRERPPESAPSHPSESAVPDSSS